MTESEVPMAILKVARLGHPVLRKTAKEVSKAEIKTAEFQTFLDDMVDTMREYEGIGLAAPQVHRSQRVSVIELPEEGSARYPNQPPTGLQFFINPKVTILTQDLGRYWEGCLSVPGMRGLVERPSKVKVDYLNREGKTAEFVADGFIAAVVQHEFDHLDGVLYVDRLVSSKNFAFDQEFERYWLPDAEDGELPE
mgnify:CR=1 FL=1